MYERFKELLLKNNISAYKVSKDTGITNTLFSDWKNGKSKPKVDKLQKIADYFHVPLEWLIGVSDDREVIVKTQKDISSIISVKRESLTDRERNLVKMYRMLPDTFKSLLDSTAEMYVKQTNEDKRKEYKSI